MDFGLRVGFRGGFDQSVQSPSGMQKVDMLRVMLASMSWILVDQLRTHCVEVHVHFALIALRREQVVNQRSIELFVFLASIRLDLFQSTS